MNKTFCFLLISLLILQSIQAKVLSQKANTKYSNVQIVSDYDFDSVVLQSSIPVLAVFTATWCGPCKALNPIVESISNDFAGKLLVVKIDVDESTQTAKKYGIRSVPVSVKFYYGSKGGSQAGLTNRETLLRLMGL